MTNAQQLDTSDSGTEHNPAAHAEHAHPNGAQYVRIALILATITAVEVALYYISLPNGLMTTTLLALSAVKFALVAGFFMHLRFDSSIFTIMFAGGLVMTVLAFIAVLAMFSVF